MNRRIGKPPSSRGAKRVEWHGRPAIRLSNGVVEMVALQGGGHIAEFRFAGDACKPETNALWECPWEGAAPGTGNRVVPDSLKLNGMPIAPAKHYRVTVNSFMASGGDNFTVFVKGSNVQQGGIDLDVMKSYFKAKGTIDPPVRNRITRLN